MIFCDFESSFTLSISPPHGLKRIQLQKRLFIHTMSKDVTVNISSAFLHKLSLPSVSGNINRERIRIYSEMFIGGAIILSAMDRIAFYRQIDSAYTLHPRILKMIDIREG